MKRTICWLILLFCAAGGQAQEKESQAEPTFFRAVAGNWEGTLEYQDYSADKRVTLKTYLSITPARNGNAARFLTVYDDFGKILKKEQTVSIDRAAKKYAANDSVFQIVEIERGKIVLAGSGEDGETIEPIRLTITFDENSLRFLKETRTPWQFRNQLVLKRRTGSVLAPKILTRAELAEDFEVLKRALTAMHPGIYRYQTPDAMDELFGALKAKLDRPLPEGEFFRLVAELTNRIYCGHTYLNPFNQNALLRERLFNGKTYLPFYFRIVDGKIIVTENASGAALSAGSEIKKINGVEARKIIGKLLRVTVADGMNATGNRVKSLELRRFEAERFALFDRFFPLYFPLRDQRFRIEAIDFASGKRRRFQTAAMTKDERTAEIEKRYGKAPAYDDGWKFGIWSDKIAYLKIENSITWRLKKIKFKEFLADCFAALRNRKVGNLIIDLRGNDGGDTEVGNQLARYLAKSNLPPYIASRRLVRNVAPQPELLKYLDTYSDFLKASLAGGLPASIYRKAENPFFEILPNENVTSYPPVEPHPNNFEGSAYIISDASNASATFQFLNYARENKLATLVGETTGGNRQGINGGNYFFLSLPNSRLEIDIPVYFLAPLGDREDKGVVPDLAVEKDSADIGNNFDRELSVVKKLIAER